MKHEMKLDYEPFSKIQNKSKKIEMRLYDEKRQLIKPNDLIEFTNRETNEKLLTKVVALHRFSSFKNLYNFFDKTMLGYSKDEIADYKDMEKYYSPHKQREYGVVGIELKLVKEKKVGIGLFNN